MQKKKRKKKADWLTKAKKRAWPSQPTGKLAKRAFTGCIKMISERDGNNFIHSQYSTNYHCEG